jgi:hypothetical protein
MITIERKLAVLLIALGSSTGVLTACGSDDPKEGHLLEAPPYDQDAEEERLRKMQLIRVHPDDPPEGEDPYSDEEWDIIDDPGTTEDDEKPALFISNVLGRPYEYTECKNKTSACLRATCMLEFRTGVAAQLMKIAENAESITVKKVYDLQATGSTVTREAPEDWIFTVPPQTAAVRSQVARRAADQYSVALTEAVNVLKGAPLEFNGTTGACTETAVRKTAAAHLVEAYHSGRRAYEVAAGFDTAVADAQWGSTPLPTLGAQRAISGSALSRAAAAHLLVGGQDGIEGSTSSPLCTSPELSQQTKLAISVIRDAAPRPSDVVAMAAALQTTPVATNTPDLLDGDLEYGSVKQRLQFFRGMVFPEGVAAYYGLQKADFNAAFKYLAEEIEAFARSPRQKVAANAEPPRDHQGPFYYRYAGTAVPPQRLPDAYYAALARTDLDLAAQSAPVQSDARRTAIQSTPPGQPVVQILGGQANFMQFASSWASYFLGMADYQPEGPAEDVGTIVAQVASDGAVQGTLSQCSFDGYDVFALQWRTGGAPDGVRLVRGEDGLRCAVLGNVEGEPCVIGAHTVTNLRFTAGASLSWVSANLASDNGFGAPLGTERFYLVAQNHGDPTAPQPGQFKALAGFVPWGATNLSDPAKQCHHIPIIPELDTKVAKLLEPSDEWCARSAVECDGVRFDERLPLENELASDGDPVESSWKQYLTKARLAADESDRLVQEYLSAGLSADEREEELSIRRQGQLEKAAAELETLQDICGTAVDIESLMDALGTTDDASMAGALDGSDTVGGACTNASEFDDGSVCINERKVKVWRRVVSASENAELQKLQACIKEFADTQPYTHLGIGSLCYWQGDGAEGATETDNDGEVGEVICNPLDRPEGISDTQRCPWPKEGEDGCKSGRELTNEWSLKWFDLGERLPQAPDSTLCDDIRTLRKNPSGNASFSSAELFMQSNVGSIRDGLEFEAKYGGYVEVKYLGKRMWSTGGVGAGPNENEWPCENTTGGGAIELPPSCTSGEGSGLFCEPVNCRSEDARAGMNNRIMKAMIALELVSGYQGAPKIEFWLPAMVSRSVYPRDSAPFNVGMRVPLFDYTTGLEQPLIDEHGNQLFSQERVLERVNAHYRTYEEDGIVESTNGVRKAYKLPGQPWWKIYSADESKHFALVRAHVHSDHEPRLFEPFFQGLANQGDSGYFAQRLGGTTHDHAIDWVKKQGFGAKLNSPYNAIIGNLAHDLRGLWCCSHESGGSGVPGIGEYSDDCGSFYSNLLDERQLWWDREQKLQSSTEYLWSMCSGDIREMVTNGIGFDTASAGNELLDGLELMCQVAQSGEGAFGCAYPPTIESVDDLPKLTAFLDCKASEIAYNASAVIYPNMPTFVVKDLQGNAAASAVNGEIGQAVSELRSAMKAIADSGDDWARILRAFAAEVEIIRSRLKSKNLEDEIAGAQFRSTMWNQITSCATAVSSAVASSQASAGSTAGANGMTAAFTCANSALQIGIAKEIEGLQGQLNDEERKMIFADAEKVFLGVEEDLAAQAEFMTESAERIQRAIGDIQDLRDQARRSMDKALWHMNFHAANEASISNALGAGEATARERYIRAHDNAKQMANLAKRAIEQRLGVKLATMRTDLPLVEAPQTWESTVCDTAPVDYEAVSSGTGSYANAYIGDYVTKLENLVESYRLENDFHEGADTSVVSLRDDVLNIRKKCEVDSLNLLYETSALDCATAVQQTAPGWYLRGCDWTDPQVAEEHCVTVAAEGSPFGAAESPSAGAPGYTVRFGDGLGCVNTENCTWQQGAALVQDVTLTPGRYRFSWYVDQSQDWYVDEAKNTAAYNAAKNAGQVWRSGSPVGRVEGGAKTVAGHATVWERRYFSFDVTEPGTVSVGFESGLGEIHVGAPMLERVDMVIPEAERTPFAFSNTTDKRTEMRPECEDTQGELFRSQAHWTRSCDRLCADGFSEGCTGDAQTYCYWETSFDVSQRAIEAGDAFVQSGFARGNFNYRIDSLAVNFIGTGLRNCEDSQLPSTCYSAGFVPYTLIHQGPYYVRNHFGEDFKAHLFEGRIEHGRGLGIERYISNPISSADQTLLDSYTRGELQGRPLDGHFVLRVWDEPGVNFDAIEDVQIVLNYRYWTRFN